MRAKKTDIGITKTITALHKSLYTLLKHCNFKQITIDALCGEALMSRAAFYSHFSDKYDLLLEWLITFISKNIAADDSYEKIENTVGQFINENRRVLKNIVDGADRDTLRALYEVTHFILNLNFEENTGGKKDAKDAVWDNFLIYCFIYSVSSQLCDEGLSDITPINIHLYTIMKMFRRV